MRVLQQCMYFPPEVGGLESHAYYLCRELVRLGDEVTMVTSRSLPDTPREEWMDGVRVVRTWFPARNQVGWTLHTLASTPRYLGFAVKADVLHAQTFGSALPGLIARHLLRKPLVLTLHTSHFLRLAKNRAWRPVLRHIIRSADWLLAASEEIRDVALELDPHARAEALTNGVDTAVFRPVHSALPPPRARRIIVPRRLFAKNGVEYLVRALPVVREQIDVETIIVGDGPERSRLEALAAELGIARSVKFLGTRLNMEMPGLFASAEVAVLPSLMEATSVAALEAMSCEVPVAASNVGGLPEIVDESVGTLFRPGDPDDLAARLVELLRRPDLREAGGRARQRVVDRWSLDRLARRHREVYEVVVRERSRPRKGKT